MNIWEKYQKPGKQLKIKIMMNDNQNERETLYDTISEYKVFLTKGQYN